MTEPASMNIAPPPEMRRTTSNPYFCALSASTSFLRDWKLPITTAGSSHSQMRSVGLRRPEPTSSASTWSSAICTTGLNAGPWMSCHS
jgi:hypothetical protein